MKLDSRKRFLDWATLRLKPGREFEFLSQRFERFIDGKSRGVGRKLKQHASRLSEVN
jgi:hypothetical protein